MIGEVRKHSGELSLAYDYPTVITAQPAFNTVQSTF